MKRATTLCLFAGLFASNVLVGGNAVALTGLAFVVGCAIAVIGLMFDRNIRSLNAASQWMIVKDQAVVSSLFGLVFAVICVWTLVSDRAPGLDFAGLGVLLGYSSGSLLWWVRARQRSVA